MYMGHIFPKICNFPSLRTRLFVSLFVLNYVSYVEIGTRCRRFARAPKHEEARAKEIRIIVSMLNSPEEPRCFRQYRLD